MKKLLVIIALLCSVIGLNAQSISHIETTKNWYYIYDQNGKKIKTLSVRRLGVVGVLLPEHFVQ
jgi:hypothetical protein